MLMEAPTAAGKNGKLSVRDLARARKAALLLLTLFVGTAAVSVPLASNFPTPLFAGVSSYLIWCSTTSIIYCLFLRFQAGDLGEPIDRQMRKNRQAEADTGHRGGPNSKAPPPRILVTACQLGLVVIAIVLVIGSAPKGDAQLNSRATTLLRLASITFLVAGCLLYFASSVVQTVQGRADLSPLNGLLYHARLACCACLATAGAIILFLSTARDYNVWLGWFLLLLTWIFAIETVIGFVARFFQPAGMRDGKSPVAESLLLDRVFGRGDGWLGSVKSFENLIGVRVGEVWVLRFLRQIVEPIILALIIVVWLSTCLTAIPAGSRGVRVLLGRYQEPVLQPGLHVTLPWPFERMEVVATEQVRSSSLGFDKDLSGPVLWTEKHVEGEKNLLVGNAETLLTINVPILYRISDPVAYLRTTSNAEEALLSIAERKLLQLTGSRESFAIMTEERQAISQVLKKAVQAEVDRLGLGFEILFVGLKDIHPPVDVAPAYQEVISAEEEKEQAIDEARAERAQTLPEINAQANRLKVEAQGEYQNRVLTAEGEAARFTLLADIDKVDALLLRPRLRLDALQEALAKPAKIILGVPSNFKEKFYLDLRKVGDLPPP
jgi:HflK protein